MSSSRQKLCASRSLPLSFNLLSPRVHFPSPKLPDQNPNKTFFSPLSLEASETLEMARMAWREAARRCSHQRQQTRTPTWSATREIVEKARGGGARVVGVGGKGILGWYLGMLERRPVVTKSVTAGVVFAASDLSSQVITKEAGTPFDIVRTLRMAGYGVIVLGPTLHLWFNFISKFLPKRDMLTTLKKIVVGQTVFGPIMTSVYFSTNAVLQGENFTEIIARLKRDLYPTITSGLLYWPMADFITFKFVAVRLQPVVCNTFSFFWTIYLTQMASSGKANSDENETLQASSGQSTSSLRISERKSRNDEKALTL